MMFNKKLRESDKVCVVWCGVAWRGTAQVGNANK